MALVTTDDVQAWLTKNRIEIEIVDDLPEEVNISAEILASISTRYTVTTWVSPSTTPLLVKSIISARVAALRYAKHYADQLEENSYSDWLNMWAMDILKGIISGTIPLTDVPVSELLVAQTAASISFLPDDTTTPSARFTMDMSF